MRKILIVLAAFALTGCATGCKEYCILGFGPGNETFEKISLASDRSDPCQVGTTPERRAQLGRPEGYERPAWCFGGKPTRRAQVYDRYNRRVGEIRY